MTIAINGSGTITGISVGGLNDNIITKNEMATGGAWAPAGTVLQVVQGAELTSIVSNSSSTFADTSISATITPTSTTSKVLVITNWNANVRDTGDGQAYGEVQLVRGTTAIYNPSPAAAYSPFISIGNATSVDWWGTLSFTYFDSPATTNATTYKLQSRIVDGTYYRVSGGHLVLMEIAA